MTINAIEIRQSGYVCNQSAVTGYLLSRGVRLLSDSVAMIYWFTSAKRNALIPVDLTFPYNDFTIELILRVSSNKR